MGVAASREGHVTGGGLTVLGCLVRGAAAASPAASVRAVRPGVHGNSGGKGGPSCELGEGGSGNRVRRAGSGLVCPQCPLPQCQKQKMGGEPDLPTSCVKSRASAISDVPRCSWLGPGLSAMLSNSLVSPTSGAQVRRPPDPSGALSCSAYDVSFGRDWRVVGAGSARDCPCEGAVRHEGGPGEAQYDLHPPSGARGGGGGWHDPCISRPSPPLSRALLSPQKAGQKFFEASILSAPKAPKRIVACQPQTLEGEGGRV